MRYLYVIIAALILVTGFIVINQKDRSIGLRRIPHRLETTRDQLKLIADQLHEHHKVKGVYPTNDQGLMSIKNKVITKQRKLNMADFSRQAYAYSRMRVRPSGLLSIWGDPFIYENRNGLSKSAFSHSGVNVDKEQIYSIQVDDGIYVWSLSAQQQYNRYKYWHGRLNVAYAIVIIVSLVFIALFISSCWRVSRRLANRVERALKLGWSMLSGLLVALFVFFFFMPLGAATCYEMSVMWAREPKLTKDYIAIMQKYRDKGIISNQAYNKLLKALDHDNRYSWINR